MKSQHYLLRTWSNPQQSSIPQFHIEDEHNWSPIQVEGTPNVPQSLIMQKKKPFFGVVFN